MNNAFEYKPDVRIVVIVSSSVWIKREEIIAQSMPHTVYREAVEAVVEFVDFCRHEHRPHCTEPPDERKKPKKHSEFDECTADLREKDECVEDAEDADGVCCHPHR